MSIEIRPEDLQVTVQRTGVLGTPVWVQIIHLPTGKRFVGEAKSELQAKADAMRQLRESLNLPPIHGVVDLAEFLVVLNKIFHQPCGTWIKVIGIPGVPPTLEAFVGAAAEHVCP